MVKEKMLVFPVTEFEVEALVDSQLTWEEEKQVRQEMARNPALQAYHDRIMQQKKQIVSWWMNACSGYGGTH